MRMIPVQSSDLARVGYESGTLCIQFNSGGIYEYYNVPESVYNGLMSASSHGKYFHQFIKSNYRYQRIG